MQDLEGYWLASTPFMAGDATSIADLVVVMELTQLHMLDGALKVMSCTGGHVVTNGSVGAARLDPQKGSDQSLPALHSTPANGGLSGCRMRPVESSQNPPTAAISVSQQLCFPMLLHPSLSWLSLCDSRLWCVGAKHGGTAATVPEGPEVDAENTVRHRASFLGGAPDAAQGHRKCSEMEGQHKESIKALAASAPGCIIPAIIAARGTCWQVAIIRTKSASHHGRSDGPIDIIIGYVDYM